MLRFWPLLFFVIPLVEIYFLVQVGQQIGAWMTILLVIVTAVIGVTLLRQQGMRTLMKANQAMQAGQMPATEMFDGFILAAVGILLLTPGFFTDAVGFVLLVPAVRKALMRLLLRNLSLHSVSGFQSGGFAGGPFDQADQANSRDTGASGRHTIDGDYKREDP